MQELQLDLLLLMLHYVHFYEFENAIFHFVFALWKNVKFFEISVFIISLVIVTYIYLTI